MLATAPTTQKSLDFTYRHDSIGELPIHVRTFNYPRGSYKKLYPHYSLVINVMLKAVKEEKKLSKTYKSNNVTDLDFFIKKSIIQLIMDEGISQIKGWCLANAFVGINQYDQPVL